MLISNKIKSNQILKIKIDKWLLFILNFKVIDIVIFIKKIILHNRKIAQTLTLALIFLFFLNKILGRHFKVLLFVAKKINQKYFIRKTKENKITRIYWA